MQTLLVISGPSGSGKSHLANRLMEMLGDKCSRFVDDSANVRFEVYKALNGGKTLVIIEEQPGVGPHSWNHLATAGAIEVVFVSMA